MYGGLWTRMGGKQAIPFSLSGYHTTPCIRTLRLWGATPLVVAAKLLLLFGKKENKPPPPKSHPTQTPFGLLPGEGGSLVPLSYQTCLPAHCLEDSWDLPPPHTSPSRTRALTQARFGSPSIRATVSSVFKAATGTYVWPQTSRWKAFCLPLGSDPLLWLTHLGLLPYSCTMQGILHELWWAQDGQTLPTSSKQFGRIPGSPSFSVTLYSPQCSNITIC